MARAEGIEIYFRGCLQLCLLRGHAGPVAAHMPMSFRPGGITVKDGLWVMLQG